MPGSTAFGHILVEISHFAAHFIYHVPEVASCYVKRLSHTEINSLQDTKNRKLFGLRLLKNTLFVLVLYTYGNLPRTLLNRFLGLLLDGNHYVVILIKIRLNRFLVCIGGESGAWFLGMAVEAVLVSAG
jgi:hypothetical protein